MKILHFFSLFCLTTFTAFAQEKVANEAIISQMKVDAKENLLDKWYPLVIDKEDGGYYSEITYDFQIGEKHDKMIVTQARHIWTNSVAAEFFPDKQNNLNYAAHGFEFLRDEIGRAHV